MTTYEYNMDRYWTARNDQDAAYEAAFEALLHHLGTAGLDYSNCSIDDDGNNATITPLRSNPHGLALVINYDIDDDGYFDLGQCPHRFKADHMPAFDDEGYDIADDAVDAVDLLAHLVKNEMPLLPDYEYLMGTLMALGEDAA